MGCCTHKLNKLFLQFSSFFVINVYFSEIERGKNWTERKMKKKIWFKLLLSIPRAKSFAYFRFFFSLSDSTSADAKYLEGSTYSSSKSVQGESRAAARVFRFPGNSTGPLMIYWNDYKSLFGINLSLSLMALRWQIFFIQKSAKSA